MDVDLSQRGRASIDFLVSSARASMKLSGMVRQDIAAAGITEAVLAEDLDERIAQMDEALADSRAFKVQTLMGEWSAKQHGLIAREAFEEIRPEMEPQFEALADGPTTINAFPHFTGPPAYMDNVWIHRTHGGWDGHEHQGFIHAEMVHQRYLTTVFGGNIFQQRRAVLDHLPRKDYKRVFEIGVSSGFHTLALADAFPNAQISGCDFSRPMLEQAQRLANERQMAWTLYVGSGEDTRLPAGSFDLVSSFIILHELPAKAIEEIFAEAFRLLEPGGAMIATDVPPYAQQDKLTTWRYDSGAIHGGEPYWREAGQVDTVALAKAAGFDKARAFLLPGGGNYWVTIAEKA